MASNEIAEALLRHLSEDGGKRAGRPFDASTRLLDGTLDSLSLIELVAFVEATYGIPVPPDDVVPANFDTVAHVTRYVERSRRRTSGLSEPGIAD